MIVYVQFEDATEKKIVSWFLRNPLPRSEEKFLGEVETSDLRYNEYYESMAEAIQQGMPSPA